MLICFTVREGDLHDEPVVIVEAAGHWPIVLPYEYSMNGKLGRVVCEEYEKAYSKKAVCKRISAKTITLEVA